MSKPEKSPEESRLSPGDISQKYPAPVPVTILLNEDCTGTIQYNSRNDVEESEARRRLSAWIPRRLLKERGLGGGTSALVRAADEAEGEGTT